ncbi:MAG: hypothetical protein V4574_01330 [Pseudomonadota bacterium]
MSYAFNIAGYSAIIEAFLERGYTPIGYRDAIAGKALLLRHDIDISLDHAVRQAEINAGLGVFATFFFLISAEQYNLVSAPGRDALAAVRANGQRIGLHFDAALYPDDADLQARAAEECDILATLAGTALEAVSFHRPVKALQGLEGSFAGYPHAYEPRFFSGMEYCSDSRGRFHHGGPFERAAFQNGAPFHLLTHPIWWMREPELSPIDALLDFVAAREPHLRRNLADNCSPFADYLAEAR